jgi:hypothetical protein
VCFMGVTLTGGRRNLNSPNPSIPWHKVALVLNHSPMECMVHWYRKESVTRFGCTAYDIKAMVEDIMLQEVDDFRGARLACHSCVASVHPACLVQRLSGQLFVARFPVLSNGLGFTSTPSERVMPGFWALRRFSNACTKLSAERLRLQRKPSETWIA